MKTLNVTVAILLVVGGLNWGLVGLFGFDLVAAIFGGQSTLLPRVVFGLVGFGAVYQALSLKPIQRRWAVSTSQA